MRWFADTSVAVPYVVASHAQHETVVQWVDDRPVQLPAHAALETYSVLTRLPGDARLERLDAAKLISESFGRPDLLETRLMRSLVDTLAIKGVAGGAAYDALIGLTAMRARATLLTRDARAAGTYETIGATIEFAPS